MIQLMKYEFRKTLAVKLIAFGAAAIAEIAYLIGLWGNKENLLATAIVLLLMITFTSLTVIGLASVVILHRDVNTRQSYMLFMTPNSSYKIMGAKMLENGLSILLVGACFFALGALDITLLFAHEDSLARLWDMITTFLRQLNEEITFEFPVLLTFTIDLLGSWISTISAMYLGVIISAALLNGKRFNGLVSFILIVLLLWGMRWVQVRITQPIASVQTSFLVDALVAIIFAVVMYIVSAQIMERKLSV